MKKLHDKDSKENKNLMKMPSNPAELMDMFRDGLNNMACEFGLLAAEQLLKLEIEDLCGPLHQRQPNRLASRWGSQGGMVVISGRKIPIQKPRGRMKNGREVVLKAYERLQTDHGMPESTLRHMIRGVSCREYEGCLDPLVKGFGMKRSSVSRGFVKATATQMKSLAQRRFEGQEFIAVFIDGVAYGGEMMIVALGVKSGLGVGEKVILGLRQGATENAQVCTDLLTDLRDRGFSFENPILFVLDGAKALTAAVKRLCGPKARIQRCQQHKIRNVQGYVVDKHQEEIRQRMSEAYACKDWQEGEKKLNSLVTWLDRINPDAAKSLQEGLEETLTVAKLGLPALLAKSLVTTNPIESAFSVAGKVTHRVKRWRGGTMRQRWATAGLMRAESAFKRLKGYKEIPILKDALKKALLSKNNINDKEIILEKTVA